MQPFGNRIHSNRSLPAGSLRVKPGRNPGLELSRTLAPTSLIPFLMTLLLHGMELLRVPGQHLYDVVCMMASGLRMTEQGLLHLVEVPFALEPPSPVQPWKGR